MSEQGRRMRVEMITINIKCSDGMLEKNFSTIVSDESEIHVALMDSLNFIRSIGWKYIEHTIVLHESREGMKEPEE